MRSTALLLLLVSSLALAQGEAPAPAPAKPATKKPEVYKWVDDKGVVHYTDKPPTQNATPAELPPLQTYKRGTIPDIKKFSPSTGTSTNVSGPQIQVVTPSKEETFRSGERTVPVAVVVTPSLSPEQKLIYLLDGKPTAAATGDTSYAFTEVERGQHTVSVTLIDGDGQEISHSSPVTFYMKPPTAHK